MGKSMFDLDDDIVEKKDNNELLDKADIYCMREQFDKALEIYNNILNEDMKNQQALLGLLKVHSKYYLVYDGEDIAKDIRVIERFYPDIMDKEYAKYVMERKRYLESKTSKTTTQTQTQSQAQTQTKAQTGTGKTIFDAEADKYYNLGLQKSKTILGKVITKEVFDYFKKAAELGHPAAQYEVGNCYYKGLTVSEDKNEALKWFSKGAEQGNAYSFYMIGAMLYRGEVVSQNRAEAYKYFKKAYDHGDKSSSNHIYLGLCYEYGYGVTKNPTEAFNCYKIAADLNNTSGLYDLGLCYMYGKGVAKDYNKAKECFEKAIGIDGHSSSKTSLEKLKKMM